MKKLLVTNLIALCITAAFLAPVYAGWDPNKTESAKDQEVSNTKVAEVIANFKNNYPNLKTYFEEAHGYAIFPTVTKGGVGIGAAHGKGEVYEKGTMIGFTSLTQVTIGAQFGGQSYSEIIFFKDKETLDDFKAGKVKLGARASAVASTAGVSKDADYNQGVAVFTLSKNGLMYEATIGGQKFRFEAK